jgi:hypothetical protein
MTLEGVSFAAALLSFGLGIEVIVNARRDGDDPLLGWGALLFALFLMITNGYPVWISYFGPSS